MPHSQRSPRSRLSRIAVVGGSLAVALSLAACGSGGSGTSGADGASGSGGSGGLTTVKVSSLQGAADFATYFADHDGFFKKNGLNVKLVPIKSTADIPALLASGGLDFALGAPGAGSFNAVAQGVKDPVVLVPGVFSADTKIPGLVVSKKLVDAGYHGAADLKGKKIAIIAPMTSSQYFVTKTLAAAGLKPSDVTFVTMALPDMLTALANGAIDAAWMFEPLASKAVASGAGTVEEPVGAVAAGFPSTWLQARESLTQKSPQVVQEFVTAMTEGMKAYRDLLAQGKTDDIDAVLASYTTMTDPAQWKGVELPSVSDDGILQGSALQGFEDFLVSNGAVKKPVDPAQLLDMSYAQKAAAAAK